MTKFFRDCFTGPNGTTWQWLRVGIGIGTVMMAIGMGVMCLVAGRSIVLGTPLDYVAFATGTTSQTVEAGAAKTEGG
jgi:hypothetical protein